MKPRTCKSEIWGFSVCKTFQRLLTFICYKFQNLFLGTQTDSFRFLSFCGKLKLSAVSDLQLLECMDSDNIRQKAPELL